jgi:translation elongation factor P/translation initiation factor 5A
MESYVSGYVSCCDIKVNTIILVKDKLGKVTEFTVHKSGKHGGAKKVVTAVDLFNDTKIIHTFSTSVSKN